jgi:hypothetical protein
MPKQRPPGTITHTVFLPEELHKQVTTLAEYGAADDLIIECISEAMKPRWEKWLTQEYNKLSYDTNGENGQRTVRRGAPPNAGKTSKENRKNKS